MPLSFSPRISAGDLCPRPTPERARCSRAPPSTGRRPPAALGPGPPSPSAGRRIPVGVGHLWVPQPALAARDCSCLRIRRLSLGPQRRRVCRGGRGWDKGKAQVPLHFFRIRLSLQWEAPCGRGWASFETIPGSRPDSCSLLALAGRWNLPELLRRRVWGPHPRTTDLGIVVLNICIFHTQAVSPKTLSVKNTHSTMCELRVSFAPSPLNCWCAPSCPSKV